MAEIVPIRPNQKVITVTEIGVFKRCRRMWSYSYQDKIAPIRETPYFFVGRMVHRTLAEWTEMPQQSLEALWANVIKEELEFFKQRYKDAIGADPDETELDLVLAEAEKPLRMVQNYRRHWRTPLPDGFHLLQAEQTCMVRIPTLDDVYLEGTLDGFVVEEKSQRIYVLERKTYEARPNLDALESNEQFVGYCWILKQLFPDYELGGVLYDGLWKREEPPKGRKFEDLFLRQLILKDDYELEQWEEQLVSVATDMVNEPLIYPNRVWQGCWDDKNYNQLCTAQSKGDDYEYILDTYYAPKPKVNWFESEEADA